MDASHAARRCPRYAASASTAESLGTSAGAFHGRHGPLGSTPREQSHDFAEATTRPGTSAPRARASSPTTAPGSPPHGSDVLPAGNSPVAGRYAKDGRRVRASTTPA